MGKVLTFTSLFWAITLRSSWGFPTGFISTQVLTISCFFSAVIAATAPPILRPRIPILSGDYTAFVTKKSRDFKASDISPEMVMSSKTALAVPENRKSNLKTAIPMELNARGKFNKKPVSLRFRTCKTMEKNNSGRIINIPWNMNHPYKL